MQSGDEDTLRLALFAKRCRGALCAKRRWHDESPSVIREAMLLSIICEVTPACEIASGKGQLMPYVSLRISLLLHALKHNCFVKHEGLQWQID